MWRLVADVLHLDVMSIGIYQSNELPRENDSTALPAILMYLSFKLTLTLADQSPRQRNRI